MAEKIILGVQEDIDNFIASFVSYQSIDYAAFSDIWKQMKFHGIFSGRTSVREVKYLTNEIFCQLVNRTAPCFLKEERICAVYLLYGTFHLQPLKDRVRIRIELDHWQDLSFFMKSVRAECVDVVFCFNKLKCAYAFEFVGALPVFTLETLNSRKPNEVVSQIQWKENVKSKEVIEEAILDSLDTESEWANLQHDYNGLKDQLKMLSLKEEGRLPTVNLEKREFTFAPVDLNIGSKNTTKETKEPMKYKTIHALWKNERLVIEDERIVPLGSPLVDEDCEEMDTSEEPPVISIVVQESFET